MGVITINLLDFKFLETRGYHSSFHLWEDREKEYMLTDLVEIDFIELPKFREVENHMAKYDVIIGKIADDATNTTLTAYIAGAFGMMGSKEADEFCIKRLLPDKLKDQYCFKTIEALECLHFVEGEKVWLKK